MIRPHLPTNLSTAFGCLLAATLFTSVVAGEAGTDADSETLATPPATNAASPEVTTASASTGRASTPAEPDPDAGVANPGADPKVALEFEEKLDGRCYILSSGGKLVVMHNRDSQQAVKYRLIRMFADLPQMGRTVGTIAPGESIKLGCSEVDGRYQHWVVERASFVQP